MTFDPSTAKPETAFDPSTARPDVGPPLGAVLQTAVKMRPDDVAEAERLAKRYPAPVDVLVRNLDKVRPQAEADALGDALRSSPILAERFRVNPFVAAMARDDVSALAKIEQFMRDVGGAAKAGVFRASRGAAGTFQAGLELVAPVLDPLEPVTAIGGNPLRRLAEGFGMLGAQAGETAKTAMPKTEGDLAGGFFSGIQSLTQNLLAMPMAFLPGGQGAALTMMTAGTGGDAYQQAREKDLPMSQALPFAASQAAIEYATEKLPLGALLKDVKVGAGFLQTLGRQIALEVPGEQIATVLQDLNEWAILNPEKPFSAYIAERPSAAAQTLVATIVGAGGNVAVAQGLEKLTERLTREGANMQRAGVLNKSLEDAMKAAEGSLLRERSPEQFRAMMAEMGDNAQVWVDAEVLNQLPADVLRQMEGVVDELPAALAINAPVPVKVADALTLLPGSPGADVFLQNARVAPDAPSFAEAEAASQKAGEYLQQEAERVIQQAQDQDAVRASQDAVKANIAQQLTATGRFRSAVVDGYATWAAAFYTAYGSRLGLTAEQFYQRYPLRILGAPSAGGQVLNAPRPGRLDGIEGYHYSTAARPTIVTSAFGTGLQGSSKDEYLNAVDKRLAKRSYFYIDKGTGINPEAGVGGIGHRASLSNVYDADADPLRLKTGRDKLGFESAVLDAGFSGYLTRMDGTQSGQVIMLGDQAIPAEVLGPLAKTQGRQVPAPAARASLGRDAVVDALRGRNDLPGGELTAQRWGEILQRKAPVEWQAMAEAGVFDGNGRYYKDGLIREFEKRTEAPVYEQGAKVDKLQMVAERGERATGKRAVFTPEEKKAIKESAEAVGVSVAEITRVVREHKLAHPTSQGWAALTFSKAKVDKGKIVYRYKNIPYDFSSKGESQLEPGTSEYKRRVGAVARAMVDEVRRVFVRASNGDKNAQNILAQAGWYKAMRARLRQEFGGLGDLFADLLGATSPNTPVRDNWSNAIDALRRAMRGDFDELMPKWVAWVENVDALETEFRGWFNAQLAELETRAAETAPDRAERLARLEAEEKAAREEYEVRRQQEESENPTSKDKKGNPKAKTLGEIRKEPGWKALSKTAEKKAVRDEESAYAKARIFEMPEYKARRDALSEAREIPDELLPVKESGSKYGFNGKNVIRAMVDLWRIVKNADSDIGRGGTAPKALNFSGNLIGFRERATIDVWAARMLQRLAGGLRIPSMAETGVSGDMLEDGTTTLQFGFGQDVFSDAVKRIRADEELKTNETLAKINDDDLQAVVWFVEKEIWTVNNWTSAAGEGGSFELEASLTGTSQQARVKELRRILDSSKSKPDAKAKAREELAKLERSVDRFVGGLSIQMSADTQGVDFVPTDADMARLANEVRLAAYEADDGATVLGSKAVSTEGRYGGVERSLDLEIIAREGYDPSRLWLEMLRQAQATKQDSTFLSRVLREDEKPDPLRHRPGIEIYFREAAARGKLEDLLSDLAQEGVEFLTVIVDGRRSPAAMAGEMPPAVGVRIQYVPEFEQRYGMDDLSRLDDAALSARLTEKAQELDQLAVRVTKSVEGVSFAGQFWYDTQVAFSSEYQEKIDALTTGTAEGEGGAPRAVGWSGQPVRSGLESADRHAREVSQREPGGAVGGNAPSALNQEGLTDGRSQQTGDRAGRYSGGNLAPLEGAPNVAGATGSDPRLVAVAEQYARDNGIVLRRQAEYVKVDVERAKRIAAAYDAMRHDPQNPRVKEAYADLIRQTLAQYRALEAAGYKFWFMDPANDPYQGNPWNAMRDLRANQSMAVFPTEAGFGSGATELNVDDNPLLADTGIEWPYSTPDGPKKRVLANDLFRAVHDAFGHGLEGAGFRAQGEENAWQAHVRLFTGPAVGAITSETRGQNSWLNFGPYGEKNQTAKVEDTVFADQKTGLMPEWTWAEGRAADESGTLEQQAPTPRGTFNPQTLELVLNFNADLSTWFHETGHFFLEVLADVASQPDAPAQIAEDYAKVLAWFGVTPEQWAGFTLDEKRPYHERWAESIEQYVMEGKAPSVELQPVMRRFAAWLKSVYQSIKQFLAQRGVVQPGGEGLEQSAYHGTPHRGITKFSTDKIGTGEGAQAYGWGLYFASKREIAEHYRKTLQGGPLGFKVAEAAQQALGTTYDEAASSSAFIDGVRTVAGQGEDAVRAAIVQTAKRMAASQWPGDQRLAERVRALADNSAVVKAINEEAAGQLYEVDIPEDSEMLLWDRPLSEQPDAAKLREVAAEEDLPVQYQKRALQSDQTGEDFYKALSQVLGSDQAASRVLESYGIKGIKYLDGGSRGAGKGSYNYVVFSGDDVAIRDQFYQGGEQQPLNIQLNDDIRRVMDRMLATDEQIAQANEVAGLMPDEQADGEAAERLQKRSMADLKWAVKARDKVIAALRRQAREIEKGIREQVTAEVDAMPEMQAKRKLDELRKTSPEYKAALKAWQTQRQAAKDASAQSIRDNLLATEGAGLKGLEKGQFLARKKREIENQAEAAALAWEADNAKPERPLAANDMEVAAIADSFGFESVEAMLQAIDAFGKRADAIDGLTERRMLEEHGDLIDERAIQEAANEAVHNEARARSLATELRTQAEMLNARTDTGETNVRGAKITVNALVEAAKQFGANVVSRTPLRDLKAKAWQHTAAERRASKRWQEATAAGKTDEAVKAKQDQMLNHAAAKAAQDAQVEAKKILDFFRRVLKGNDETVVEKGRDPDIVNAARAVLAAYGLESPASKSAQAYLDAVKTYDPGTYAVIEPMVTAAMQSAQPLDALTFEELQGLHEQVEAMWHLAKRSRQMEVNGDLLDIDDIADQVYTRLEEIGIPDRVPGEGGPVTKAEERALFLRQGLSFLRRVEQWAESMDGKYGGPFLRFIFQPIKAAADAYRSDRVTYRKKLQALADNIAPIVGDKTIEAPEIGYTFGGKDSTSGLAMNEILHAILHTGNESNKRKLLLGRQWATENPDGTIDTSRWDAFIARMVNEGKLQPAHYDFIQGVWDLLEETKPLAQKAHRDAFGRYFKEVDADAFTDPWGQTRRGGYVPAMVDPRLVKDNELRKLAEAENESMAFAFPQPAKGFTMSRVEGYNRPLMLDLRTLGQHIDKVLLFGHMTVPARSVRRLITNKKVSQPLERVQPNAIGSMLQPWLQRSAQQIVETPIVGAGKWGRVPGIVRARAGMALMFANVSNAIQQVTGLSTAMVKVRPSFMMRAMAQHVAHPLKSAQAVWAASKYMDDRAKNEVSVMNEQMEAILLKPGVYERAQNWSMRHAYFLQTAIDNALSPIVWTGAYNQAMADGMSHDEAVRFADGTVRQTQGSTLPEDVSRLETGPAYARVFTQFIGYFNMVANTNATALQQIAREVGLKKGAGRAFSVVMLGMLVPIWAAEAIAVAFKGGPDDEDDDGYLDDWLKAVFGFGTAKGTLAMIPVLGQAINSGINRLDNNPMNDRISLSPGMSLIESALGGNVQTVAEIIDEDKDVNARRAVRDAATLVSVFTGLPLYAVARPVGYMAGVADGKIEPTDPLDLTRGLITGTPSPESKQR